MKKDLDYDIVIVGAGPAGATLARLLPDSYRVLLLDKKPLAEADWPMKCCGGLLSESAQKVMAEMNLNLPTEVLIQPQTFVLRVMDLNYPLERSYQKRYYNMDRGKFEQWLVSLVPDTVEKRGGYAVKDFHRCLQGVELVIKNRANGEEKRIRSRMVAAADGASSVFRHKLYKNCDDPRYVSIQEWYENTGGIDYYAAIVDEQVTDFYSWLIPKGNAVILGGAFRQDKTLGSPSDCFLRLKEGLMARGLLLGERLRREGCELLRPVNNRMMTGNRKIALLGEAAGFISPSSAEGFSYAFRSALGLAEAIKARGIENFAGQYAAACRPLRRNIWLRNVKAWGMYHPLTRRAALRSGFGALKG
ncbi:oxidoreductase [Lachnospiraceae bacterium oral taxon 500]|nr:oxidoreductase [Lachnospiraceae bacterium oral taxon 500]